MEIQNIQRGKTNHNILLYTCCKYAKKWAKFLKSQNTSTNMKKAKLKNEKTRMTNIGYVSKSKVIYVLS